MKIRSTIYCQHSKLYQVTPSGCTEFNQASSPRFFFNTCLVAREHYWEKTVSYPTANLSELRRIVASERQTISPLQEPAEAAIVALGQGRATILYYVIDSRTKSFCLSIGIWRIQPETLPLYRKLHSQNGTYCVANGVSEFTLIISPESMSSLPQSSQFNQFPSLAAAQAIQLSASEYASAVARFSPLKIADLVQDTADLSRKIYKKNRHLSKAILVAAGCALCFYLSTTTAYLLWKKSYLDNQISQTQSQAAGALAVHSSLSELTASLNAVSDTMDAHPSKSAVIRLLVQLAEPHAVDWQRVSIMASQVTISGHASSATSLMSELSSRDGVSNVKFLSPPVAKKTGSDYFNMSFNVSQKDLLHDEK